MELGCALMYMCASNQTIWEIFLVLSIKKNEYSTRYCHTLKYTNQSYTTAAVVVKKYLYLLTRIDITR